MPLTEDNITRERDLKSERRASKDVSEGGAHGEDERVVNSQGAHVHLQPSARFEDALSSGEELNGRQVSRDLDLVRIDVYDDMVPATPLLTQWAERDAGVPARDDASPLTRLGKAHVLSRQLNHERVKLNTRGA